MWFDLRDVERINPATGVGYQVFYSGRSYPATGENRWFDSHMSVLMYNNWQTSLVNGYDAVFIGGFVLFATNTFCRPETQHFQKNNSFSFFDQKIAK